MRKNHLFVLTPVLLMSVLSSCAKTEKRKVTFDLNYSGCAASTSVEVELNKKVSEPSKPTRDRYDFVGWYTEKDCVTAYNFDSVVTNDITLYACWTISNFSYTLSEENTAIDVGDQKTLTITLSDKSLLNEVDITWTNNDPEHIEEISISADKLSYTFKGKAISSELELKDSIKVNVQPKHGASKEKTCKVNVRKVFDGTVSETEWKDAINYLLSNESNNNFKYTYNYNGVKQYINKDGVNAEWIYSDTSSNETVHSYETIENVLLSIEKIYNRDVISGFKLFSFITYNLSSVDDLKDSFKNFTFNTSSLQYEYVAATCSQKMKFNKDRKIVSLISDYTNENIVESIEFTYGDAKVELPKVDNRSTLVKEEGKQKLVTDSIVFQYSSGNSRIGGFTVLDLSTITDLDFTKDIKITLLNENGESTSDIDRMVYGIDNNLGESQIDAKNGEVRINASKLNNARYFSIYPDAGDKTDYSKKYKICVEYNVTPNP